MISTELSKGILLGILFCLIQMVGHAQDQIALSHENGKVLFRNHCGRCHGVEGGGGTGPDLRRPSLVSAPDDNSLAAIISGGIGGTGMPGNWMLDESQVNDIVAYVRFMGSQAAEPVSGNADNGKLVYNKSICASCHVIDGDGSSLGPELTRIAQMRGVGYLIKAIRHPGLQKPRDRSGFISYLVVTVDDGTQTVTGIRVNEDSFTLQIKDGSNRYHTFRKGDIKSISYQMDESLMPSFGETLSESDIRDLVAYLISQVQ